MWLPAHDIRFNYTGITREANAAKIPRPRPRAGYRQDMTLCDVVSLFVTAAFGTARSLSDDQRRAIPARELANVFANCIYAPLPSHLIFSAIAGACVKLDKSDYGVCEVSAPTLEFDSSDPSLPGFFAKSTGVLLRSLKEFRRFTVLK